MNLLRLDRWILFVAQGFGAGRIPVAPGTMGSLVGMIWMLLLAWPGSPILYICGLLLGIPFSVLAAARAEKLLGQTDPGSIVIDEIIAVPIAGLALIFSPSSAAGQGKTLQFHGLSAADILHDHALGLLMVFVLFRVFDVLKPWPVGASQKLPNGWGVTVDDVLAALYVNAVIWAWLAVAR